MTAKKPAARKTTAKKPAAKGTRHRAPAKKKTADKPPRKPPRQTAVLRAVNRDLAEIAKPKKELATGALAETARALARDIDSPDTSPTQRAGCARSLADTLDALRAQMPAGQTKDIVDELGGRRAARLAGRAGT